MESPVLATFRRGMTNVDVDLAQDQQKTVEQLVGGKALVINSGSGPCRYVFHAPTSQKSCSELVTELEALWGDFSVVVEEVKTTGGRSLTVVLRPATRVLGLRVPGAVKERVMSLLHLLALLVVFLLLSLFAVDLSVRPWPNPFLRSTFVGRAVRMLKEWKDSSSLF